MPIPGTKRRRYLEENIKATQITLTADELAAINELLAQHVFLGMRYPTNIIDEHNLNG